MGDNVPASVASRAGFLAIHFGFQNAYVSKRSANGFVWLESREPEMGDAIDSIRTKHRGYHLTFFNTGLYAVIFLAINYGLVAAGM